MKIKSVSLHNFAKYDEVNVSFDENVTYLVGKNGSGKSTLGISAIWFVLQGLAEKASGGNNPLIGERFRFIGPKSASSKGQLVLIDETRDNAEIVVTRKLTKSGTEVSFLAPDDYGVLDQAWLNNLFNLFLIAPKKFTELNPREQAKALGIDTKQYDDAIAALKNEYTIINRELKQYSNLEEVEKVERVDIAELQAKKEAIRTDLNDQYRKNKQHNEDLERERDRQCDQIDREVMIHNMNVHNATLAYNECVSAHATLVTNGYTGSEVEDFLTKLEKGIGTPKVAADLYPAPLKLQDPMPDDSELKAIDQQLIEAAATNEKAFLYEQYLIKVKERDAKKAELDQNVADQKKKEDERLQYIKSFKFPFSNLSVGEDGELLLNNKPIREPYFSTGELLKVIPILISSRNPELKYVFLQDFNLLDDEKQAEIESYLVSKGFQLVVEMVGKTKIDDKNCILLKDNVVVEDYEVVKQPELI